MIRPVAILTLAAVAIWSAPTAAAPPAAGKDAGNLSRERPFLRADHHEGAHADHAAEGVDRRTGQGTGIIRSVNVEERSLTIEHGPIEGVGMPAMTMGFGVTGAVVLSGLAEGDAVAFRIKRGRDDSYRVTAICTTRTNGSDCLEAAGNR